MLTHWETPLQSLSAITRISAHSVSIMQLTIMHKHHQTLSDTFYSYIL